MLRKIIIPSPKSKDVINFNEVNWEDDISIYDSFNSLVGIIARTNNGKEEGWSRQFKYEAVFFSNMRIILGDPTDLRALCQYLIQKGWELRTNRE